MQKNTRVNNSLNGHDYQKGAFAWRSQSLYILYLISGWWAGIGCAAKGGVVIAGQGCGGSTSSTDKTWKEPLKVKAGREPPLWWNTVHPHKSAWLKMHLLTPLKCQQHDHCELLLTMRCKSPCHVDFMKVIQTFAFMFDTLHVTSLYS